MLAQHLQKQLNKWGDLGFGERQAQSPTISISCMNPGLLKKVTTTRATAAPFG